MYTEKNSNTEIAAWQGMYIFIFVAIAKLFTRNTAPL